MGSVCSICKFTGDGEAFNDHMRSHSTVIVEEPVEVKIVDVSAELAATVDAVRDEVLSLRQEIGAIQASGATRDDVGAVYSALLALTDRVAALELLAQSIQNGATFPIAEIGSSTTMGG